MLLQPSHLAHVLKPLSPVDFKKNVHAPVSSVSHSTDSWRAASRLQLFSNGIRFSVSDLSPPNARLLKSLYRERAAISLFDALGSPATSQDTALSFPQETIDLVAETLGRFYDIATKSYNVPPGQIAAFATEAMRRASNAGVLLDAIKLVAPGLPVRILAPEIETLLGAMGARSAFSQVQGLMLDLGGGSVQMSWMDSQSASTNAQQHENYEIAAAMSGQSLPFGAARLIGILKDGKPVEVQNAEGSLRDGLGAAFSKLKAAFPTLAALADNSKRSSNARVLSEAQGIDVFLCGGGFRGYGSILMHTEPISPYYPIPGCVGAYTAPGEAFRDVNRMSAINEGTAGKIQGMSRRRRSQFPAIATVVKALIDVVPQVRSVTFCGGGNREGALMMTLPRQMREANPLVLLAQQRSDGKVQEGSSVLEELMSTFKSAIPEAAVFEQATATKASHDLLPSVFSLSLGPLFAHSIWDGAGEDADANAARVLHVATTRDASCPGMTHLARSVLAITVCSRWGGGLKESDLQLRNAFSSLLDRTHPMASSWAEYIGAVAATIATVVPAWPARVGQIRDAISFAASMDRGKSKTKVRLQVTVAAKTSRGVDLEDIEDLFKGVGKAGPEDKERLIKVDATVTGA